MNEITNQDIDYDEFMDSVMSQLFKHEIFLKLTKDLNIKKIWIDQKKLRKC